MGSSWEQVYGATIGRVLEPVLRWLYGPWLAAATVAAVALAYFVVRRDEGEDWIAAILQPRPLAVASVGAGLAWVVVWWWGSRMRPLVLVAEFVSKGEDAAVGAAEALRDRILDAILDVAEAQNVEKQMSAKAFDVKADPRQAEDARRRAKAGQAAALVAGRVRVESGETKWDVRVFIADHRVRGVPGQGADRQEMVLPSQEIDVATQIKRANTLSKEVAVTATLAVGVALLSRGKYEDAYSVFTTRGVETPVGLLYAAISALVMEDWRAAHDRAAESFRMEPLVPAAAVAAIGAFESGDRPQGRIWLNRFSEAKGVDNNWPTFLRDVSYLGLMYGVQDVMLDLQEGMRAAGGRMGEGMSRIERSGEIGKLLRNGEYGEVIERYEVPPDESDPDDMAGYALALAQIGNRDEAAEYAARAETAVLHASLEEGDPTFWNSHPARRIALAYATLGDPDSYARVWGAILERVRRSGPESLQSVLAMHNLDLDDIWRKHHGDVGVEILTHPAVSSVTQKYQTWLDEQVDPTGAGRLADDEDWSGVVDVLSPAPTDKQVKEWGLYALALAQLQSPNSKTAAQEAETVIEAALPGSAEAATLLAKAYALNGDMASFARVWRWSLDGSSAVRRDSQIRRMRLWCLLEERVGGQFFEAPEVQLAIDSMGSECRQDLHNGETTDPRHP